MPRGHQQSSRLAGAVRATRMRRGWSRETLAHESGLSWAAITQIETGRRREVRVSSLDALANALDVSLDYLVRGEVSPVMLQHRAYLFTSPDDLADMVGPAITSGVDAGHAVLVVTTRPNQAAVKEAIGQLHDRVQFADSIEWYSTPTEATAKYEEFTRLALAAGAHWVDLFGEPIWAGRSRPETAGWTRYESVLNMLFASWPVGVNCLYDAAALSSRIVSDVSHTHPVLVSRDGPRVSSSYEEPMQFVTS